MRKICVVTGGRAEYGLLRRLMKLLKDDSEISLQIIATNMHLSPEFGLTYKEIEIDGFIINKKVEMLLSSDTENATAKSVGLATIGFADAYEDLRPDLIVVLGDRYEILAAVTVALFYKIPVAHLHGGEITEGAYDDLMRHAITKMSHLHFTSTEEYRKRVIQLGEQPARVFNVGAIGLDNIKHYKLLSKEELEKNINFHITDSSVMVTYHPETLASKSPEVQFGNLLSVLELFSELRVIFTLPNSDTNGRVIIKMIEQFVKSNRERAVSFSSLGRVRYLSLLQFIKVVIGNSSSGIIEVPYFGIPTLNIGDRQKGRQRACSVIDCSAEFDDIKEKLLSALTWKATDNYIIDLPYFKENTAEQILSVLKSSNLDDIIHKRFHNM